MICVEVKLTAAEVNALPERVRQYIAALETRCDPSGDIQTIAVLREDRDALAIQVCDDLSLDILHDPA